MSFGGLLKTQHEGIARKTINECKVEYIGLGAHYHF
jgi:hypothetical protein